MSETCQGCYGSGRFGTCGGCGEFNKAVESSRPCVRCGGTGKEPIDEVLYVAELNRRVAARSAA